MSTPEPYWYFTASIEDPTGVVVTTTATIPAWSAWKRVVETSELVQMGAAHTINRITETMRQAAEEVPF